MGAFWMPSDKLNLDLNDKWMNEWRVLISTWVCYLYIRKDKGCGTSSLSNIGALFLWVQNSKVDSILDRLRGIPLWSFTKRRTPKKITSVTENGRKLWRPRKSSEEQKTLSSIPAALYRIINSGPLHCVERIVRKWYDLHQAKAVSALPPAAFNSFSGGYNVNSVLQYLWRH